MKYLITERQYNLILEQTNDVDWLIDWFKKVPKEKLVKTFTILDKNGQKKTMSREEILKLLSDKSKVVIINDPKKMKEFESDLGYFINAWNPEFMEPWQKKYVGKIVINGNWKNIMKNSPQYVGLKNIDDLKHHEQIHLLQQPQNDKKQHWVATGSKIISNFCKGNPEPTCNVAYYNEPAEIYAHLFNLRKFIGIEPQDKIIDASASIKNQLATINVTVDRNGKTIKLPTKSVNKEFVSFWVIYCCNKSFKESLMSLHNRLAKAENPTQPETSYMA